MTDQVKNKTHKNGRPSKAEQVEIQKKLRSYFEKSISPAIAASETGINIKTVNKYYDEWYVEIKNSQQPDFIERCKIEKERHILAYNHQLLEMYKIQDDLKSQTINCKSGGKPQSEKWLYKQRIEVANAITNLIGKMINLANAPTADISLENKTKELLKDNGLT